MGKSVPALPQVIMPTFDVAMYDAAQKHLDRARVSVINTDADYEAEAEELKGCTARGRMYESGYKQTTAPLNEALTSLRAWWNRPWDLQKQELSIRKARMAEYLGKKAAEQRRLQQVADAQAATARARLEARADKADAVGNADKAAALAQQAALTMAPVIRTEPPKIAGQSVREVWQFQIEDAALLPREYLMPDESKIRRYVTAMKADAKVAGVRIWSEKRIASGV